MRYIIMQIIFILVAALVGLALLDEEGAILGGVIGYLIAEIVILKKRVVQLELNVTAKHVEDSDSESVVFAPVDEFFQEKKKPAPADKIPVAMPKLQKVEMANEPAIGTIDKTTSSQPAWIDNLFASIGSASDSCGDLIKRFLTGGNLVLKMGIIILFLGMAFLIKYAAQQNLFPIEYRLVAAVLGGIALLFLGWRLRIKNPGYGLGLQGGGVGILYLVVYGAAKLYELIPVPLSFILMVALVVLSGVLAILQDAKVLAVFGIIGGFLAPVLMSTGEGNHVMLFSYYGLINVGILGIALHKAWRELNLLGFVFTFGVGTLWGSQGYQPEYFSTTEPFLVLFFLFYVAISVLFAHRQPIHLRGFVDGPLVFGLPLIVTGLQYTLVKDFPYGMAISAFALGFFYLLLATVLWRRLAGGMKILCEAFLAMGVMFASMTIPLAFDSNWTTATWALEGAAMVWVGVRQKRLLARLFGLLLQVGAALTFLEGVYYPYGVITFLNNYFLGCLCIAFAALFSSYYVGCNQEKLRKLERYLPIPLLIWGMLWWYYGGIQEIDRHFHHIRVHNGVLLFSSASTIFMAIVARKWHWRQLAIGSSVLLPIMWLMAGAGIALTSYSTHLLDGWGSLAWAVSFYCQYRLLHQFDTKWPVRLAGYWHVATFWLLLSIACTEISWLLGVTFRLSDVWQVTSWGIVPGATVFAIICWGRKLKWPVAKWEAYYHGIGLTVPVAMLAIWSFLCLLLAGDPAPIMFIPLINPLELTQLFVIIVIIKWVLESQAEKCYPPGFIPPAFSYWLIAALFFSWLNGGVARIVHFYSGIPYHFDLLYHSVVFQAGIAALWSLCALSTTIWATRSRNRLVWCCGATLLGLVVLKLFIVDLSGTGTVARIISFLVVGVLMLVIGYFSPMPPAQKEDSV